ncbi:MAG: twin-arginine translocase subunit TatB [Sphingobium sp.]|nr:MAG: twin-arginine translocase subunit TatB [Sphingobium sp.]
MFDIGSTEFLLIVIVAVIVIGPKDLPRALYKVGQVVGKGRAMARHFRTGIDAMIREAELQELEKKWAAQNERIMAEHPPETATEEPHAALPAPEAVTPAETQSAFPGFPEASSPGADEPVKDGPVKDGPSA